MLAKVCLEMRLIYSLYNYIQRIHRAPGVLEEYDIALLPHPVANASASVQSCTRLHVPLPFQAASVPIEMARGGTPHFELNER